jgi:quinoprotein glucose dehydrogenase
MGKVPAIVALVLGLGIYIANPSMSYGVSSKVTPVNSGTQGWQVYDGQAAGDHYSSLAQINRKNVKNLVVAWKFDTGERGGLETNPIIIGDVLYACTPQHSVIALNAETGKQLWIFDSGLEGLARSRGVSYWTDGHESRIFAGFRNYLYAMDAKTGKMIRGFGEDGKVDLRKGLRGDYLKQSIGMTSPGAIYKDLIVVGGQNPETHPSPPGDVRAYDVHTGAIRWTFHTIPHPGEFGYDTWPKDAWKNGGAANNWAGMTVDTKRGIVYVPTGSAVFDFYGGDRIGNDLFADSLLALDAETGKRIWHFQGIHHDIWDRDFPTAPALVTLTRNGKPIDAVAQPSKSGYLFILDRVTGKPLFPVVETPFPASTVPGEIASPTQPIPTLPAPFTRQSVTEDMLTTRTPEAHAWAAKQFNSMAGGGQFAPPSVDKLTVDLPGFAGGAEWGGPAVDPTTGVIYINENDTAWLVGLTVLPPPGSPAEKTFQSQCSVCHGMDRAGSPPAIPSLVGIDGKLTDKEIADTIRQGKGRMPAFSNLSDEQVQAVVRYISKAPLREYRPERKSANAPAADQVTPNADELAAKDDMPYKSIGFRRFLDLEGYPAIAPPWGTLNAIDMNTGKYLWKIPFGEYPELAAKGMHNTGSDNYGGPVVTAGGLLFIGATVFDQKFHAFDSRTGELLWETELPFSGLATPATYMVNGKQYVVIASGGGQSSRKPSGGVYVAFALP